MSWRLSGVLVTICPPVGSRSIPTSELSTVDFPALWDPTTQRRGISTLSPALARAWARAISSPARTTVKSSALGSGRTPRAAEPRGESAPGPEEDIAQTRPTTLEAVS